MTTGQLRFSGTCLPAQCRGPSLDNLESYGVLCSKLLAGMAFPRWQPSQASPQQQEAVLSMLLDAALRQWRQHWRMAALQPSSSGPPSAH